MLPHIIHPHDPSDNATPRKPSPANLTTRSQSARHTSTTHHPITHADRARFQQRSPCCCALPTAVTPRPEQTQFPSLRFRQSARALTAASRTPVLPSSFPKLLGPAMINSHARRRDSSHPKRAAVLVCQSHSGCCSTSQSRRRSCCRSI